MDTLDSKIDYIVEQVLKRISERMTIPVEASGRHVHLSQESLEILFGKGYNLTKKRELSQPEQYLCNEKVTLIGPKGSIHNVAILGPVRSKTQIEVSKTDALALGIKAPVRQSGDIKGSAPIIIASERGVLRVEEGVIVAKRHIHITPEDALKFNVKDREIVGVQITGDRSVILGEVLVRVNKNYKTRVHIDYDEANACSYKKDMTAKIIRWEGIDDNE